MHALLQGRKQRSVLPGHRHTPREAARRNKEAARLLPGHSVATRPLGVYEQIAYQLGGLR